MQKLSAAFELYARWPYHFEPLEVIKNECQYAQSGGLSFLGGTEKVSSTRERKGLVNVKTHTVPVGATPPPSMRHIDTTEQCHGHRTIASPPDGVASMCDMCRRYGCILRCVVASTLSSTTKARKVHHGQRQPPGKR